MMRVSFFHSNRQGKKYVAIFTELNDDEDGDYEKEIKRVHFGARGYEDYTTHHDDERKARYIARHRAREDWNDYMSAGALSRWILWEEKDGKTDCQTKKPLYHLWIWQDRRPYL